MGGGDRAGMRRGALEQAFGGFGEEAGFGDDVGDAVRRQLVEPVGIAGQDHLACLAEADEAGQQGRVDDGRHADLDLGQPEGCRGGDHAEVAGEGQFECSAQAVSADRGDGDDRRPPDGPHDPGELADECLRAGPVHADERLDVHPRAERRRSGAREDETRDAWTEIHHDVPESGQVFGMQHVQLVRPAEGNPEIRSATIDCDISHSPLDRRRGRVVLVADKVDVERLVRDEQERAVFLLGRAVLHDPAFGEPHEAPGRIAALMGAEGAVEDVDAVGAGMAVPRVGEARPVDHLEDHHPGLRVAHERNVLKVRPDVRDREQLPGGGIRVNDGQLDRFHGFGHGGSNRWRGRASGYLAQYQNELDVDIRCLGQDPQGAGVRREDVTWRLLLVRSGYPAADGYRLN